MIPELRETLWLMDWLSTRAYSKWPVAVEAGSSMVGAGSLVAVDLMNRMFGVERRSRSLESLCCLQYLTGL
jgi:hypothetical protein